MRGVLYGVGVGPGDPDQMTIKALKTIDLCPVIIVPGERAEESVAYKIAAAAYEGIKDKDILAVSMPMTKDAQLLEENHERAAKTVCAYLDQGKDVAFLTLGDPTIYSTYLYVHRKVKNRGYETAIVSGIPSFCAVAARLNNGLVEKAEELHVIPASYQIQESLKMPGTKVLMKSGRQMAKVKELVAKTGKDVMMIENCGMDNEVIHEGLETIPDHPSYYSLMIVKDR